MSKRKRRNTPRSQPFLSGVPTVYCAGEPTPSGFRRCGHVESSNSNPRHSSAGGSVMLPSLMNTLFFLAKLLYSASTVTWSRQSSLSQS